MVKVFKPISLPTDIRFPYQPQKDYFPTWLEFAAKNYEQFFSDELTGSPYTVPNNKFLIITSASIWFFSTTNSGSRRLQIYGGKIILSVGAPVNQPVVNSISYINPLKIPSGSTINVDATGTGVTEAYVQGFLVPFVA